MSNNASLAPMSEQQVRERAYELYLARAGQAGDDISDWLAAEREVNEYQPQEKRTRAARLALNVGLLM